MANCINKDCPIHLPTCFPSCFFYSDDKCLYESPMTVFDTVKVLMAKGLTLGDAIAKVENSLSARLPEHMIELIKADVG